MDLTYNNIFFVLTLLFQGYPNSLLNHNQLWQKLFNNLVTTRIEMTLQDLRSIETSQGMQFYFVISCDKPVLRVNKNLATFDSRKKMEIRLDFAT